MRLTIKLPWPPKEVSPNARSRTYHKAARFKKAYRETCGKEAIAWGANRMKFDGKVYVQIEFYPPDRRRRDDDNMIGAFKAGRDGIADVIGVDDADWVTSYKFPKETGGYIIAVLSSEPM